MKLTAKEKQALHKSIIRAVRQKLLKWDYLRSKNSPNGIGGSVTIDRVQQREYCALVGLENDPNLTTLVKKGAWYSMRCSVEAAFGVKQLHGTGGRYGGNAQLMVMERQIDAHGGLYYTLAKDTIAAIRLPEDAQAQEAIERKRQLLITKNMSARDGLEATPVSSKKDLNPAPADDDAESVETLEC